MTTWAAPEFEELNLGSEIGTYYEDEGDPSFLTGREPVSGNAPVVEEPPAAFKGMACA